MLLEQFGPFFFNQMNSFHNDTLTLSRMLSLPESLPESTSCLHISSLVRNFENTELHIDP